MNTLLPPDQGHIFNLLRVVSNLFNSITAKEGEQIDQGEMKMP